MFIVNISSKIIYGFIFIATLLLVLSIVCITYLMPLIMEKQVDAKFRLENNTKQFDIFLKTPFPILAKLYIFNVENPSEILMGKKPRVKEVGPYVYKQYRSKSVISTNDTKDTLVLYDYLRFVYDQNASAGLSDDDLVTVINPLYLGLLQTVEDMVGSARVISGCLQSILQDQNKLFITVPVKDFFFNGLKFCTKSKSFWCKIPEHLVCSIAKTKKNSDVLEDGSLMFSIFNYKVRGPSGPFTMNRGIKDISQLGELSEYNYSEYLNTWKKNSMCNKVHGKNGQSFPPRLSKSALVEIYSADLCRTVPLPFLKEESFKGVKGYHFEVTPATFYTENARSDCFCTNLTKGLYAQNFCFLDGVFDSQACTGAPTIMSFPHFMYAEHYTDLVDGLKPNISEHKTFVLLEPNTGAPLMLSSRLQVNTVLRPIKGVKQMQSVQRALFPIFWIDEHLELPDEYVDRLNNEYFNVVKLVFIVEWGVLGFSIGLIVGLSFCLVCKAGFFNFRSKKVNL